MDLQTEDDDYEGEDGEVHPREWDGASGEEEGGPNLYAD